MNRYVDWHAEMDYELTTGDGFDFAKLTQSSNTGDDSEPVDVNMTLDAALWLHTRLGQMIADELRRTSEAVSAISRRLVMQELDPDKTRRIIAAGTVEQIRIEETS